MKVYLLLYNNWRYPIDKMVFASCGNAKAKAKTIMDSNKGITGWQIKEDENCKFNASSIGLSITITELEVIE